MRVVIDTNVFVSGIFFKGPPYQIMKAWSENKLRFAITPAILNEYKRVGESLAEQFPNINLAPIIDLVTIKSDIFPDEELPEPVCVDPDDDKFIACAIASKSKLIISGDKHLLNVSGYQEIRVLKPRPFVDEFKI